MTKHSYINELLRSTNLTKIMLAGIWGISRQQVHNILKEKKLITDVMIEAVKEHLQNQNVMKEPATKYKSNYIDMKTLNLLDETIRILQNELDEKSQIIKILIDKIPDQKKKAAGI